jgi:hypothetical protein
MVGEIYDVDHNTAAEPNVIYRATEPLTVKNGKLVSASAFKRFLKNPLAVGGTAAGILLLVGGGAAFAIAAKKKKARMAGGVGSRVSKKRRAARKRRR